MTDYDVIISGGGMVGASLARAPGGADLRVAVIERGHHPGRSGVHVARASLR
jgi:flavin-dependent dehydrogenase